MIPLTLCAGRPLEEATKRLIHTYYQDDRNSVQMPGTRDCMVIRDDEGKRTVQKRLILLNLKELFEGFRSEYPDVKVGFSTFASLRPKECNFAGSPGTHNVCLCPLHQNIKLMMIGKYLSWC